ncbi:MAG TPA: HAD family hydrolase [Polyangia bacterium]|nr:HAD family hydrolase [Polyangia bacterium]
MKLKAAIFDVDGTLVDSNGAHAEAWRDALLEFGFDKPVSEIRPLIGMGGDKVIARLTGLDSESDRGKQLSAWRARRFREAYLHTIRPFPKARELFEAMRDDGVKRALASSGKRDELKPLLELAGIDGLIDHFVCADDAEESKPDADLFLVALDRLKCERDVVRAVGDTPYDVEASRRAGIEIIAVRCGGWDDQHLQGACLIVDDPAAVLRHYLQNLRPE